MAKSRINVPMRKKGNLGGKSLRVAKKTLTVSHIKREPLDVDAAQILTPSKIKIVLTKFDLPPGFGNGFVPPKSNQCEKVGKTIENVELAETLVDINQNKLDLESAVALLKTKEEEIELLKAENDRLKEKIRTCQCTNASTFLDNPLESTHENVADNQLPDSTIANKPDDEMEKLNIHASRKIKRKKSKRKIATNRKHVSKTKSKDALEENEEHLLLDAGSETDLISPPEQIDSGIELDPDQVNYARLKPISVSPSLHHDFHTKMPLSAPAICSTAVSPPKRNQDLCKYGKFSSNNEGIVKVAFDYPQSTNNEAAELKSEFKKEELPLFPKYSEFRIKEVTPLPRYHAPKEFDNDMTVQACKERHEPLDVQEKLRKKWADHRDKQLELHEALMKKQKMSSHDLFPEPEKSFENDVDEIEAIQVSSKVPVSAFGHNVPELGCEFFSLSWFNPKKYRPPEKLKSLR